MSQDILVDFYPVDFYAYVRALQKNDYEGELVMIPKIIHYVWFGGKPFGEVEEKCIASWKKYCPDYEIKLWNEDNFDLEAAGIYAQQAYDEKQWAFVSDVARLYVLKEYGGIYMDTDMEVIKPLDDFLKLPAFFGFEIETEISTGIIGAEPHHPFIEEWYQDYADRTFIKEDGTHDRKTNVIRITEIMEEKGFKMDNTKQTFEDVTLFPREYFSPKDYYTREVDDTKNTYAIHQFTGSWL